jgi:BON domain
LEVAMKRKIGKIGKRRDPPRSRAWLLVAATLTGVVLGRFFDPISGRRRRAQLRDSSVRFVRRRGRNAGRLAAHLRGTTRKIAHLREKRKDFDDATLADKVKSELFRPAGVPKGQININVQNGVVQLRGEVPQPELIDDLEGRVRRIHGVRAVENLLHPPGVAPQMHQ